MAAQDVNESFLKNGAHYVRNAIDYYPFATYVFKEEIALQTRARRTYTTGELIELSKKEKGKPLSLRAY